MSTSALCQLGHVASFRQLAERGITRRQLATLLQRGEILRPLRGTYACAHLDALTMQAARVGGAVACVSVLRDAGVWAGHETRPHFLLPPTASRIPSGDLRAPPHYHWEQPRFGMETRWRVSRMQALWQAMYCLDAEHAIAAMESAIHEGFLTENEVDRLALFAPRRLMADIHHLVPNSGSGNETVVRLRLVRAGHQAEPQGAVPGVGHQDLLVDKCLGLEIDSHAWHDGDEQRAIDYDRDLRAAGLGRVTLRIRPAHIYSSWPTTLAVIERAAIDAARGLENRRGRILMKPDDPL